VGRDLEDRVAGGVDDPLARSLMLLAELLDDLGPRRCLVAEHAAAGPVRERVENLEREPVGVRRKGLSSHHPHQLPVSRGRVLALRPLDEPARNRGRSGLRRAAGQFLHVAETERLEIREVEPADRFRDVAKCVRPFVAVVGRIRQLTRPDGVEDDDARPWHEAILGSLWRPFSASSAWSCSLSRPSRSPPA
jgi:hypothetical protein